MPDAQAKALTERMDRFYDHFYEVHNEPVPLLAAQLVFDAQAEINRLRSELARTERNRDMWKGQSERQAAMLAELRAATHPACVHCGGTGAIVRETPGLPAAQSSSGFAATAKLERIACRCQTEAEAGL